MSNSNPQTIIGIDPGTKRIGYGVIKISPHTCTFVSAGLFIPRIAKNIAQQDLFKQIRLSLVKLAKDYSPELIAIEKIYFGHNISSALAVSEVRGALTLLAQQLTIPVIDVHPTNVKQVVCGYGRADKTAVRKMVFRLITGIPKSLTSRDAVDALAIALAGYSSLRRQNILKIDNQ
jgi:crossover junction endodeoxyribonuclease RuvC